jgi:hypothetical protein
MIFIAEIGKTVLSPNFEVTLVKTDQNGEPIFQALDQREREGPQIQKDIKIRERIYQKETQPIRMDYGKFPYFSCQFC